MYLDIAKVTRAEAYRALVGVVTPRPIAWVTTVDAAGRVNLAPFSFFNAVSGDPPAVIFCPALKRDGTKKDTLANLDEVPEFVINTATSPLAQAVVKTSAELPRGSSEVEFAGLTLAESRKVRPPRVAESPAHLECKLLQVISVGTGRIVLGEIVAMHIDDNVLNSDRRVDPRKLQALGRLGADEYCQSTNVFSMPRP